MLQLDIACDVRQVAWSSSEVARQIWQISREVTNPEESTPSLMQMYIADADAWKHVLDAAKRHPTSQVSAAACQQASCNRHVGALAVAAYIQPHGTRCQLCPSAHTYTSPAMAPCMKTSFCRAIPLQRTVDKLEKQLAQHEAAENILDDTMSAMFCKVKEHYEQAWKVSMHACTLWGRLVQLAVINITSSYRCLLDLSMQLRTDNCKCGRHRMVTAWLYSSRRTAKRSLLLTSGGSRSSSRNWS